jgi:hypothetical protein
MQLPGLSRALGSAEQTHDQAAHTSISSQASSFRAAHLGLHIYAALDFNRQCFTWPARILHQERAPTLRHVQWAHASEGRGEDLGLLAENFITFIGSASPLPLMFPVEHQPILILIFHGHDALAA